MHAQPDRDPSPPPQKKKKKIEKSKVQKWSQTKYSINNEKLGAQMMNVTGTVVTIHVLLTHVRFLAVTQK